VEKTSVLKTSVLKTSVSKWKILLFPSGKDFCIEVEKTSISKWKRLLFPRSWETHLSSPIAFTDKKEKKIFLHM
jgi:hypothetical protein